MLASRVAETGAYIWLVLSVFEYDGLVEASVIHYFDLSYLQCGH